MSRRTGLGVLLAGLFSLVSSFASPCTLVNGECPPGRIRNPTAGIEMFQDIAYNSDPLGDFYLVVYQAGSARGLTLSPTGSLGSEIVFGPDYYVQDVNVEYNPDRNEFLVVWRYDQPLEVWGRYLTGDGGLIGSPFLIGTGGVEPRIAYSSAHQRYVVVFSGIGLGAHYTIVDGDSTSASPLILGKTTIDGLAFNARIAYGSVSNKFLITYVRDFSPPTRADVRGILLNGNGFGFGGVFPIGAGTENQQYPEVSASTTTDEFMVAYEDWSVGGNPDVQFNLVSGSGSVGVRRNLTPGEPSWNQPGPIAFDPLNGEFIATYFDGLVSGYTREVKMTTGALDRRTLFGGLNSNPLGIAIRPDPAEPQAAVVWRNFLGEDGVHVSFIALDLPPPVITSTVLPAGGKGVAYSQAVPVQGGRPPLAYSLMSGTLPPGLSGPNATTGIISGTPTTIGNFTFRVRVTDADARFDEKDLTLAITLAAPTPISPTSTTNDPTPTFQWSASPTATSYTLVVENLTDGGIVINPSGIAATNFTPGTPLASGKIYRWKVQATDGVNFSPFSQEISFEIDSILPSTVANLSGGPPTELAHTGLTIADSSGFQPGYGPEKTVDGLVSSIYASLGRTTMQSEHITYDLGAGKPVGRVRIHSRDGFGTLMPRDFVIEISNSPTSGFVVAYTANDFVAPASPGQWFTFNFTPVTGRYVRLRATETVRYSNNLYYVSFNEFEAWQTAPLGSVLLTWSAPSDDLTLPGVGTVVSYDVRYTTSATFVFGSATPYGSFPLPLPAGSQQIFLVIGLTPETIHRFGLTATDDAGNVSTVSNVAVVGSKGFPPTTVSNLSALNATLQTINLRWNAPSDPPSGGAAASYDIRRSASPITEDNFELATPVSGTVPNPASPGTQQTMTVTGLTPNTLYYFAMKGVDGGANKSNLSNVISFSTLDNIPPAPPAGFATESFDDDAVDLRWNASGDDGNLGTATSFDVRFSTNAIDENNFGSATQAGGEPNPGAPGTLHRMVVGNLSPGTTYYFAIKAVDEQSNASALSTVVNVTTLADIPEPIMVSPAAGSTLTGSTQVFQWAPNGLPATQWWVYVGSTRGGTDIHDSGSLGPALSRTVAGLPTNGSTLWLRLWYFAGFWGYADFQFTAYTAPPPPPPPQITTPAPNSTLPGASALFQWTPNGAAVTEWWIYVGATAGAKGYFDSGSLGTATQVNVTGLPTNGSTVHARLWYRLAGLWSSQDFQYTAATGSGPGNPAITSPVANSTLSGANVPFQWTANGAAVTEWWLYIGSSSGTKDIFDSQSLGTATQVLVTGLPTNGTQVFARLWYRIAGLWQFADSQYTATNVTGGGTPAIVSPTAGATLTAASQLFQWTANGAAVAEWWLYAGSTAGAKNYFDSGSLGAATAQVNATGLPTNGSTVRVRLWYRIAGLWQFVDSQYTAANLQPNIVSPTPGATLTGASQLFQWAQNGAGATEWTLYAGSTQGAKNYFDSGSLGAATTQVNATGLPTNGSTVHVRLWYRIAGLWQFSDSQYTAANLQPNIVSPTPATVLSGASVLFQWTANGVPVTEWWLYAGSTAGGTNYYDSGSLGAAATSTTATGLPTDGSTVHVALWYRVAGLWQFRLYQYTAGP